MPRFASPRFTSCSASCLAPCLAPCLATWLTAGLAAGLAVVRTQAAALAVLGLFLGSGLLALPEATAQDKTGQDKTAPDQRTERLSHWWGQWQDPTLLRLILAAQQHSPNIAQAGLRIEQARAAVVAAGLPAQPTLNLGANAQRGTLQVGAGVLTANQVALNLRSSWELDLFGRVALSREAAVARFDAEQALALAARTALAAETAATYLQFRHCEVLSDLVAREARSRQISAQALSGATQAGLAAPTQLAQARSVAAEATQRATAQSTECEALAQALATLTAMDGPTLRTLLAPGAGRLPTPHGLEITEVPANLLNQRPDVAAAERAVAAASADLGATLAERYPRLTLQGTVGPLLLALGSGSVTLLTWSIGPALSLPLIDGGRQASQEDVARAAYASAESQYRAVARQAVNEVQEALLRLRSAAQRLPQIEASALAQQQMRDGVAARLTAGLASAIDLEEADRSMLAADAARVALHRERLAAGIQLYRALGGGWDLPSSPAR